MPGILSKQHPPSSSVLKFQSLSAIFFGSSLTSAFLIWHFYRKSKRANRLAQSQKLVLAAKSSSSAANRKKKVDSEFVNQLKHILKILIPRWRCSEVGLLALISSTLVVRSLCDVWTIYLGTLLESAIITQNKAKFGRHLIQFGMTMPTMALINSTLKYATEKLQLQFRTRLTSHLLQSYMTQLTFYKISSTNIDQLISTDVDRFTQALTLIYTQLAKPFLDIIIYIYGISAAIGVQVPAYMIGYLGVAAGILIQLRKPMARLTAQEQDLEGQFRFANSRLQIHAEEVAFYGGRGWELQAMLWKFKQLTAHVSSFIEFKFVTNFAENLVAKYIATVFGYYAVSRPFLTTTTLNSLTHKQKLETYYKSGRMLVNLAQAIGRLIINAKEVSKLAGYTGRIHELMMNLDQLNNKSLTNNNNSKLFRPPPAQQEQLQLGEIQIADGIIRFERVPIVTPNGDVLLKELNLEVLSGTNILICGPNGCGKSSLFRILGELWPLKAGIMTKPETDQLFYVPQRPYMPMGTLRDQIIYPHGLKEMREKCVTDKDLESILKIVDLDWLVNSSSSFATGSSSITTKPRNLHSTAAAAAVTTDKGISVDPAADDGDERLIGQRRNWDDIDNWMDVLSGGQKQRLAMARLIYHKPQFAILDECTSAISVDVEGAIYKYCSSVGISLFSVSHRKSLWAYHDYYLYMDGKGGYKYDVITEQTVEFGT